MSSTDRQEATAEMITDIEQMEAEIEENERRKKILLSQKYEKTRERLERSRREVEEAEKKEKTKKADPKTTPTDTENKADPETTSTDTKHSKGNTDVATLVGKFDSAVDSAPQYRHPERLRLTLVGKTGSGKSATGNTLLGMDVFKTSFCPQSITVACQIECNWEVLVVDTPGLFDTEKSNEATMEEVVKCVAYTSPGLHAFLIVLAPGKFTEEQIETIRLIRTRFGEEILKYVIVLFTRLDELEAHSISVEDYVELCPEYVKDLLKKCDNRYIFLNNRANWESRTKQARDLIETVKGVFQSNNEKHYTNDLYKSVDAVIAEEREEGMLKIEKEWQTELKTILDANKKSPKEKEELRRKLEKIEGKKIIDLTKDIGNSPNLKPCVEKEMRKRKWCVVM